LVADLRPGLHGLGGAFFILLFDPTSPARSVLDVAHPCALGAGWGISAASPPGDGAAVAFSDCTSPSSSATLIASTSKLIVVVSADTADQSAPPSSSPPRSGPRAWEEGILPAVCHVRRDAATLDGALRDVAGASLSLPTVESETYSSMGGGGAACTPAMSWTL
jgi:hypothetical protein